MALIDLGSGVGAGQEAQVCIDSKVIGLMQRTLTLEEKVGQLFEMLRDPIYLYLITVLGNQAEAEDVAQEVFLELYRTLHRGRVINNVRFWLFRVAHNLAFKRREKKQRDENMDTRTWDELRERLPDPGLNPEQRVLQMEDSNVCTRRWRGSHRRRCSVCTCAPKDFATGRSAKSCTSTRRRRRSFYDGASGN